MEKVYTIIIAAGKGTRMNSKHSKLVQKILGKTLIERVATTAKNIESEKIIAVVGYKKEEVKQALKNINVEYAVQEELLGTGHAVMQAVDKMEGIEEGRVVILYGDVPILRKETIKSLIETSVRRRESATILTAIYPNPTGYGRIIRDKDSNLDRIVEEKDATEKEKLIKEINAGIYCFDVKSLKEAIKELKPNNAQKEYYLTDTIEILKNRGDRVGTYIVEDNTEILGINDRIQLEIVSKILRNRINKTHMLNGVSIEDISNTYIDESVIIGKDTQILPQTIIKENVEIGEDCVIGYGVYIGPGVKIDSGTIIEDREVII